MFCPKCGSKIGDDARFCTECGLPLGGLSGKTAAEEGPKAEPSERESSSAEVIMEPTDTETDSAIGSANAESTAEPSRSRRPRIAVTPRCTTSLCNAVRSVTA